MTAAAARQSKEALATLHVERAREQLAEARRLVDVKDMLDRAEAMRLYLKRQNATLELQADAFEIQQHALRRLGELVRELPTAPGGRPPKTRPAGETSFGSKAEALEELGVARSSANRWERLAEIPLEEFRERLEIGRAKITKDEGAGISATSASSEHDGDGWGTPPEVIAAAREVLGDIELDPASNANAQRIVRARRYNTKDRCGLANAWLAETVWLNPPFSRGLCAQFTRRWAAEAGVNFGAGLLLVNNATDTTWAQELLRKFPACFTTRIAFLGPDGKPVEDTRQGQIVFYAGDHRARFVKVFSKFGVPMGAL